MTGGIGGAGGPNQPMGPLNQQVSSTNVEPANLFAQALQSPTGSVSIPVGEAKNVLAICLQALSGNKSLSLDQILQNINNGSMPSQDNIDQLNQIGVNFTYNDGSPINKSNWTTSSVDNESINLNVKRPTDIDGQRNFMTFTNAITSNEIQDLTSKVYEEISKLQEEGGILDYSREQELKKE